MTISLMRTGSVHAPLFTLICVAIMLFLVAGCSDEDEKQQSKRAADDPKAGNYLSISCLSSNLEQSYRSDDEKIASCEGDALQFFDFNGALKLVKYSVTFINGKAVELMHPVRLYYGKLPSGRWILFAGNRTYSFSDDGCCIYKHPSDKEERQIQEFMKLKEFELSEEEKDYIKKYLSPRGIQEFRSEDPRSGLFLRAKNALPKDFFQASLQ